MSSSSSSPLVAEYKLKGVSALDTFTMDELQFLISEAKKAYEYTSPYVPIMTDIEYDTLKSYINKAVARSHAHAEAESAGSQGSSTAKNKHHTA
jgi:hypothetical protein